MKTDPKLSFDTTSGVHQGGPESSLLFYFFIDNVLRILFDKCTNKNTKFAKYYFRIIDQTCLNRNIHDDCRGTTSIEGSGYADDITKGINIRNKRTSKYLGCKIDFNHV